MGFSVCFVNFWSREDDVPDLFFPCEGGGGGGGMLDFEGGGGGGLSTTLSAGLIWLPILGVSYVSLFIWNPMKGCEGVS